jgi:hypothetical protein
VGLIALPVLLATARDVVVEPLSDRPEEKRYSGNAGNGVLEQRYPLGGGVWLHDLRAGYVASGSRQIRHKSLCHQVSGGHRHHGDRFRRFPNRSSLIAVHDDNNVGIELYELRSKDGESFFPIRHVSAFDRDVVAFDVAEVSQRCKEAGFTIRRSQK